LAGQRKGSEEGEEETGVIENFGFHVPTCCGSIAMNNPWTDDWIVIHNIIKILSHTKIAIPLDILCYTPLGSTN
jgi:hypothetical protein